VLLLCFFAISPLRRGPRLPSARRDFPRAAPRASPRRP